MASTPENWADSKVRTLCGRCNRSEKGGKVEYVNRCQITSVGVECSIIEFTELLCKRVDVHAARRGMGSLVQEQGIR